jgi:hypothetical protein
MTEGIKRNVLSDGRVFHLYTWVNSNKATVASEESNQVIADTATTALGFRVTAPNIRAAREELNIGYPRKMKHEPTPAELWQRQELLFEAVNRLALDVTTTSYPELEALCIGFGRTPWGVES